MESMLWARSNDKNVDLLHLFTSGEMYDCSFQVGGPKEKKIFRCHKLILSTVSCVFQSMFYGHFREAKRSPDEPIVMEEMDPEAFEAAMRYIYGNQITFADALIGIQVYEFAHRMQITSLLNVAVLFLNDNLDPSNVLAILDMHKEFGNKESAELCLKVLVLHSAEALSSECWLDVSADTVEAVLQLDEIRIDEVDVFKILLKWGRAALERDGVDGAADGSETLLRAKVEPFLKHVRFESMEASQVAEICTCSKVLNLEEQNAVLLATTLRDPQRLPAAVAVRQTKRPARKSATERDRLNAIINARRQIQRETRAGLNPARSGLLAPARPGATHSLYVIGYQAQ